MCARASTRRRGVFLVPALLTPMLGLLGWLSATGLGLSVWGRVLLAVGAAGFGLSRVLQPVVARRWQGTAETLAELSEQRHEPKRRAWVVWLLGVLLTIDLVLLVSVRDGRAVCVPVGLLLLAGLLGYLAWQTRGGRRLRWALGPVAGWTVSLLISTLPLMPDAGILVGEAHTRLAGLDGKLDALLGGQERIHAGQEQTHSELAAIKVQLAALNAARDAADAEGVRPIEEGEPAPERTPLTAHERAEYERLKAAAAALADAGDTEATIALYEAALRTGDAEQIEELKPAVDRLLAADAARFFEIRKAEGNRWFFAERYADAADAYLAATRLRPEDETVRKNFGASVVNALYHADGSSSRLDGLLDVLAAQVVAHHQDTHIRESLAMGLCNAAVDSRWDIPRADGLLDELRELAGMHPEDAAVRAPLVRGLGSALDHSDANSTRIGGLLDEMRGIAGRHPEDAIARRWFARGLLRALILHPPGSDRAEEMLDELRELARRFPGDGDVREWLASGLFNRFIGSVAGSDRSESLLQELHVLARNNPEDAATRESLARALVIAFDYSEEGSAGAQRWLDGLRGLAEAHPEDQLVRERLTKMLLNAFYDSDADPQHADRLLDELRLLAETHTGDLGLRERVARAYGLAIWDATHAGDAARSATMAEALVPLQDAILSQPAVMPFFRRILTAAIDFAIAQDDADAEQRLTAALKALFDD